MTTPTTTPAPKKKDRLEAWHDGSAICLIAVGAHGDPLDLGEGEVRRLIEQLEGCLRQDRKAPANAARAHIAVRPAVAADARTLAALAIQVWLDTYATDGMNDLLASHVLGEFTPAKFAASIEDAGTCLLVAEIDRHLVGYALVRFGVAQPLVASTDTELCTLYVQEPFTGCGVGSALLREVRAAVRERTGTEALWLSVNVRNRRACDFYEKHGLVEKGRTHFVLGEGRHENHVLALVPGDSRAELPPAL